jgi:hypothetical protein
VVGLLFDPEDGCGVFLRNVGLSQKYTELQVRKPYSSIAAF